MREAAGLLFECEENSGGMSDGFVPSMVAPVIFIGTVLDVSLKFPLSRIEADRGIEEGEWMTYFHSRG